MVLSHQPEGKKAERDRSGESPQTGEVIVATTEQVPEEWSHQTDLNGLEPWIQMLLSDATPK